MSSTLIFESEHFDLSEFRASIRTKQVGTLIIFSPIPSQIQTIECTYTLIIQGKQSSKFMTVVGL